MKQPMKFITISDIHIGHQEVSQLRKEFDPFIEKIHSVYNECQEEDIIFGGVAITGDLFDHQISMNSVDGKFAMELINEIATITDTYNSYFIILKGTQSHDLGQLDMFEAFSSQFENFYIANTLSTIDIFGYSVLLIPEEYMKNQTEYYEEAFSDTYDICLGHGFFRWNCFSKNEIERPMPHAAIFDQEELITVARISIFGHDHKYKEYREKIYYNGSWSRLCHGEEDEKGALLLYIDEEETRVERIINELTPIYRSIYLDKLLISYKLTVNFENSVKAIRKFKIDEKVDFLKVKISEDMVETESTMVSLILSAFNTQYKKLGIMIESPPFSLKDGKPILLLRDSDVEETEDTQATDSKFDFLFKNDLEIDEKILKYLSLKPNVDTTDIELDDIRDAISSTEK